MPESGNNHVLECKNISMNFGGLKVLSEVNIALVQGERRVILGPNGAGKTTLFNVICGELRPYQGTIEINCDDVTKKPSYTRINHGFARTFQVTNLFFELTAAENIYISIYGSQHKKLWSLKSVSSDKEVQSRAVELLEQFSIGFLKNELVKNISYGDQRLLEIVLGLSSNPKILALDEPSSGLSVAESQKLVRVLNSLDKSLTILFIEHDMDVAFEVAETVTVLHRGKVIEEGPMDEVKHSSVVRDVYMGVM